MIQGWMAKPERKWLKGQAKRRTRIVEVGVWKGRSTHILARNTPGIVWAVDHWMGTPADSDQNTLYPDAGEAAYREFKKNLRQQIAVRKVRVLRMASLEAAAHLHAKYGAAFDFVFIDADHSYEAVRADILAYRPLVRRGGILAGHDYAPKWEGVRQAVDELLPKVSVTTTIWSCTV